MLERREIVAVAKEFVWQFGANAWAPVVESGYPIPGVSLEWEEAHPQDAHALRAAIEKETHVQNERVARFLGLEEDR